jgi:oligosaccharide repeat unit polymerase
MDMRVAKVKHEGSENPGVRGISFWLSIPAMAILLPTLLTGTLLFSGVVVFEQPLVGDDTLALVYGGAVVIALIAILVVSVGRKGRIASPQEGELCINHRFFTWLVIFAFLAAAFVYTDLQLSGIWNGGDMVSVRGLLADRSSTVFLFLSQMLAPCSTIVLGSTLLAYEKLRPVTRLLGLAAGLAVPVIGSVGLGGRGYIFDALVLTAWWLLQRPAWGLPLIPRGIGLRTILPIIVVGLVAGLVMISIERSAYKDDQYKQALIFNHNLVTMDDSSQSYLGEMNPALANAYVELAFYWTGSIAVFDKINTNWDLQPAFGMAVSRVLHRRLSDMGLTTSAEEAASYFQAISWKYDFYPNAFYTLLGDMTISFGKLGGVIVLLVIGIASTQAFLVARRRYDFLLLYVSSLGYLMFFLWFQRSAFQYPTYEYGLIAALVLLIVRSVRTDSRRPLIYLASPSH